METSAQASRFISTGYEPNASAATPAAVLEFAYPYVGAFLVAVLDVDGGVPAVVLALCVLLYLLGF